MYTQKFCPIRKVRIISRYSGIMPPLTYMVTIKIMVKDLLK